MGNWLNLIGLVMSMAGACFLIWGILKSDSAIIRKFWGEVEKYWAKNPPFWFQKLPCRIAKKFGSKKTHDIDPSVIETLVPNFWGFVLLCVGFRFQIVALLVKF